MRDHLTLLINGKERRVPAQQAKQTLAELLRDELRLCGTKVVCAEGDCGACTVLVGRARHDRVRYEILDACITFLFQLDLCHVITVEGLAQGDRLHPIQQAFIDHYGSQCGYCTPGFVISLAGLLEQRRREGATVVDEATLRRALTGNLCRCTGYLQIVEAAQAVPLDAVPRLEEHYPDDHLLALESELGAEEVLLEDDPGGHLFLPQRLESAVEWLGSHPPAKVVAGATDIAVARNKGKLTLTDVLVLSDRLPGFTDVKIEENVLLAGAGASWSRVLEASRARITELARLLELFGAPQIRNAGTVGGNLVNASPIADSLPCLYVLEAMLDLAGPRGRRQLPIESFYRGYKDVDLEPGELLVGIEAPLPTSDEVLKLYKVSKRRDLDISSFAAALLLRRNGDRLSRARIAYGGVGPTVVRLEATETFLEGRDISLDVFQQAGRIARSEISPISDVRGRAEYRGRLAENALTKFYYDAYDTAALEARPSTTTV